MRAAFLTHTKVKEGGRADGSREREREKSCTEDLWRWLSRRWPLQRATGRASSFSRDRASERCVSAEIQSVCRSSRRPHTSYTTLWIFVVVRAWIFSKESAITSANHTVEYVFVCCSEREKKNASMWHVVQCRFHDGDFPRLI
jgi:hypothetical protein